MTVKFLFSVILLLNFKLIFGFRCQFLEETVNRFGYTCDLRLDSGGTEGDHVANRSDLDVKIMTIDGKNLDDFNLNQTESIMCKRFRNLETLVIKNGIKSVDLNLTQNCTNLKELSINNTELQSVSVNFFSNNQKLDWLRLSNSKFTTLPENTFSALFNLKNLALNKNQIKVLPPKIFYSLYSLEMLWLDHNKLGTLNPNWFHNLQNLEALNLGANGITKLPRNIFKSLINLQFLFLHGNKLTVIHWDSFPVNGRLNTVDFSYNKIYAIDEKFIDFTYVYWIDMMENVCSQEGIRVRNEVKDKLRKCIDNYSGL